jgi:FkbM family methyltransferase
MQRRMERIEILSDYVLNTPVTPSTLRAFVSQNGFRLLFWRILYMSLYVNLYWQLDTFRYGLLSRNRQTIKIQLFNTSYLMELNPHDRGLSRELCLYGTRELYTTNLMSTIIKDDDIIIDIGANIGYYALLESKLAPTGFVYAIEPVRENFDYLRTNVDLNKCTNVKLFNCALSNKRGKDVIFIPEARNCASLSESSNDGISRKENVLLTTLDNFVDEHVKRCPTLVRMDVEGYEHKIVKGALNLLKECKTLKIAMELHPSKISESEYDDMLRTLEAHGFKASASHDPDLHNIKHEKLSNKLRKRAHLTPYGFLGEGYEVLHKLKKENENIKIAALFTREET